MNLLIERTNRIDDWVRNDRSPSFYRNYPALFDAYYPDVSKQEVEQLSLAAYYQYHAFLIQDEIMDEGVVDDLSMLLDLRDAALLVLSELFQKDSSFWRCWVDRKKEVERALALDKELQAQTEVQFNDYCRLAQLKSSGGLLAIDAMHLLNGQPDSVIWKSLIQSHHYFSVGIQLYDDVKDFKVDWISGQFNWAVYDYKKQNSDWVKHTVEGNHKLFFLRGHASLLLDNSCRYLNLSQADLPSNIQSSWLTLGQQLEDLFKRYRQKTEIQLKVVEQKWADLQTRTESHRLPDIGQSYFASFEKAWRYLQTASESNWNDLAHWMWLSLEDGFNSGDRVHKGELFQRTLLCECISFAMNPEDAQWRDFIEKEWTFVESCKRKFGVGCWAYFDEVPELSSDIDDLAQVIQLACRFDCKDKLDEKVGRAIRLALEERAIEPGVWETWLVPLKNRTSLEQKQEWLNTKCWGRGPDPEVMANFAYSLLCFNKEKYLEHLELCRDYLLSVQEDSGGWKSRWYFGELYGTFQCLRFILSLGKEKSSSIHKALTFTLKQQNKDGGFAATEGLVSDPLSTAFALLIFKELGFKDATIISLAKSYLDSVQQPNGSWQAMPFIIAKPGEIYKSEVMTTAWVLRSLC